LLRKLRLGKPHRALS